MSGGFGIGAALAVLWLSLGDAAAQTLVYKDSSTHQKLQSQVGVGLRERGFDLHADMTLIGQDGQTRVLPRLTSSWTTLEFLDVKTVFVYEDLNGAAESSPAVDTNIVVKSEVPFIDRLEAKLRRSGGADKDTLNVGFASLDTNLDFFGGDPLGFKADMTFENAEDSAATMSKLTSSWGLGRSLDVQSVLRLEDAHGRGPRSAIDTKLVYESPFAFIDRLEGEIRRSQDASRQSLSILFPEVSSGDEYGTSFKISSKAMIEEMLGADGIEILRMGFETKFSGVLPPVLGGRNALSLKVQRGLDAGGLESSSLAYDHAWSPGYGSIGLKLNLLRDEHEVEPSMGISWSTAF